VRKPFQTWTIRSTPSGSINLLSKIFFCPAHTQRLLICLGYTKYPKFCGISEFEEISHLGLFYTPCIYSNAPDKLTASNIIQVTNDIVDKTNKGRTLRRFKLCKRHNNASHGSSYTSPPYVSMKTTSSTKTPINTPSRSIPNLTSNNYNPVLTTQTLAPLMSCTPKNINPNTNNTRRINSTVGSSSPHMIQSALLVPPARVRSQRIGSTITRNMSSPHTPTPYPFPFAHNMRNSNNNTTTNVTNSNLEDFLSRIRLPSYHLNMKNNMKPH
jgi:hypothetical protein